MIKSNFMPCGSIGPKGDDGITPHIGSNGNWYLGEKDTNIAATGPRGQRGFRGEQGLKGDKGLGIQMCNTSFDPHTTSQIDDFSQFGHTESFTATDIQNYDPILLGDQIGLLIPNSDTGNDSLYFGLVTNVTEQSVVCDSIGCVHGGVKAESTNYDDLQATSYFTKNNITLTKRKDIVYCNMEVQLKLEIPSMTKLFDIPLGFRPTHSSSIYCVFGGCVCRLIVDSNGSVQLAETVIGNTTKDREYSVSFNFRID